MSTYSSEHKDSKNVLVCPIYVRCFVTELYGKMKKVVIKLIAFDYINDPIKVWCRVSYIYNHDSSCIIKNIFQSVRYNSIFSSFAE